MELIGTAIVLVVLAVAFGLMKWGQKEDPGYKDQGHEGYRGQGYKDQGHEGQGHKG